MAENQLQQLLSLLCDQTEAQENLNEQLTKASALMALALSEDFLDHSKVIIHSYLWTLSDLIEQARDLSSQILDTLLKGAPINVNAYGSKNNQM